MSSISSVSQTPPPIPVTPIKPADNDKPGVTAAPDGDGDSDDAAGKVSSSNPPGVGTKVDLKG